MNSLSDAPSLVAPAANPPVAVEPALLPLPLPSLRQTAVRCPEALAPLSSRERQRLRRLAEDLASGATGKALQDTLRQRAESREGWLHAAWIAGYLSTRTPLPLYQNPCAVLLAGESGLAAPSEPLAARAARVVLRAIALNRRTGREAHDERHHRHIDTGLASGGLAPRHQDAYLFGTCRIPNPGRDVIRRRPFNGHIVVIRRGNFYVLPPPCETSARALRHALAAILRDQHPAEAPVGRLTALPRDDWARCREILVAADPRNTAALEQIEGALLTLSLDPPTGADEDTLVARALWSGQRDRWYDRSLHCLLTEDGHCAVTYEHTMLDLWAVTHWIHEVLLRHPDERPVPPPPGGRSSGPVPAPLHWITPRPVREALQRAEEAEHDLDRSYRAAVTRSAADVAALRTAGLSGDFVAQCAIQFAYRKTVGETPSVYEPKGMSDFRYGRTETLHPVTRETTAALAVLEDAGRGDRRQDQAALSALRTADSVHRAMIAAAARGEGTDRHLYALRHLAASSGTLLPPLLADPAVARPFTDYDISTSNVSGLPVGVSAFGPPRKDGWGIAYAVRPAGFTFCVTTGSGALRSLLNGLSEAVGRIAALTEGSR